MLVLMKTQQHLMSLSWPQNFIFSSSYWQACYFSRERGVRWTTRHPAEALGLDVVLQRVKVKDGAGVCPPHLQVFREEGKLILKNTDNVYMDCDNPVCVHLSVNKLKHMLYTTLHIRLIREHCLCNDFLFRVLSKKILFFFSSLWALIKEDNDEREIAKTTKVKAGVWICRLKTVKVRKTLHQKIKTTWKPREQQSEKSLIDCDVSLLLSD